MVTPFRELSSRLLASSADRLHVAPGNFLDRQDKSGCAQIRHFVTGEQDLPNFVVGVSQGVVHGEGMNASIDADYLAPDRYDRYYGAYAEVPGWLVNELSSKSQVLELACGTGRFAIPLTAASSKWL